MDYWNSYRTQERAASPSKTLSKRVIFSYILDYVIIFVLIVTFYLVDKVAPFYQQFSLDNYTLHYPYAVNERINVYELCIISVLAPAVIVAFYTLVIDGLFSHPARSSNGRLMRRSYTLKDRLWELNCGILGLGLSVAFSFTVTGALKNAIGKPRPDMLSRCQADLSKEQPGQFGLYTVKICTQPNAAILYDGFRSFPSGHASVAFAGLFYLSLYLSAKLHVMDSRGEVWKTFIVLVPTLGACLVSTSRTMDARHHGVDLVAGTALGILTAWGSYRQYFPPVSETWRKGRAYPIRSWGREPMELEQLALPIKEDVRPLPERSESTDAEHFGASSRFPTQTAA